MKYEFNWASSLEEKMFENVDGRRTDDGRTDDGRKTDGRRTPESLVYY